MGATAFLIGSTVLSGGGQLLGAYNQSQSIRAQGRYQQGIAESNAKFNEVMAADAIERGRTESTLVRKRAAQLRGQQRVSYAGQGVDVNSGSALTVQDETYTMGEIDYLTVKNNAWREAFGYKSQAIESRNQGRYAKMTSKIQARNTLLTGGIGALSSISDGLYKSGAFSSGGGSTQRFKPRNPTEARFNNAYNRDN